MTASTFDQFEGYVASIGDADLRMLLPRLKVPLWEITTLSVGDVRVQFGREGCGNITEGSSFPGGQVIFLPLAGRHWANGMPLHDRSVFLMRPGSEFTIHVHEAHDWCSIFVPWQFAGDNSRQTSPCRSQTKDCLVLDMDDQHMARLRWVLNRLARAVEIEPMVLTQPRSLRSVQHDLLAVCQFAFNAPIRTEETLGRPKFPRAEVRRIVRELIDQRGDEGLTIEELATAADISERTLRTMFVEYFGIPPKEYLLMHRLHRVRNALRAAEPGETTVTAIATEFGFWHFGRFAGAYRKLFGEMPSATLYGHIRRSEQSVAPT